MKNCFSVVGMFFGTLVLLASPSFSNAQILDEFLRSWDGIWIEGNLCTRFQFVVEDIQGDEAVVTYRFQQSEVHGRGRFTDERTLELSFEDTRIVFVLGPDGMRAESISSTDHFLSNEMP